MNTRTMGAVQGAMQGGKVGGPWGAVIGGVLGAARAGHAGQSLAEKIGRKPDGTLETPAESMFNVTPDELDSIKQGIDNGVL
jgi:outer membrane lipoprotein SlyB